MSRPSAEIVKLRDQLFPEGLYFCGECSEVKPLLEFHSNNRTRHGVATKCKECKNEHNRALVKRHKEEMGEDAWLAKKREQLKKWRVNTRPKRLEHFQRYEREKNLKSNYGISIDDFDRLLASQDGRCAICETPNPQRFWHIDHDHSTGEIRGILCNLCNVGLGAFKDNRHSLKMAEIYLRPRGKI